MASLGKQRRGEGKRTGGKEGEAREDMPLYTKSKTRNTAEAASPRLDSLCLRSQKTFITSQSRCCALCQRPHPMDLCVCVCKCVGNASLYVVCDTFRPNRLISTSTLKFENISADFDKKAKLTISFYSRERERERMRQCGHDFLCYDFERFDSRNNQKLKLLYKIKIRYNKIMEQPVSA